jgi:hypothetical protein
MVQLKKKMSKGLLQKQRQRQKVNVVVNVNSKNRRIVQRSGDTKPKIDPMIQMLSSRPQYISIPQQQQQPQAQPQVQFSQIKPYLEEYLKQKTLVNTKPTTLEPVGIKHEVVDEKGEDPIQTMLRQEAEDKFNYETRGRSLERSPSGSREPRYNPQTVSHSDPGTNSSSSSSLDPRIINFYKTSNDMLDNLNEELQNLQNSTLEKDKKRRNKIASDINTIIFDQQKMSEKGSQSERDNIFRKKFYKK